MSSRTWINKSLALFDRIDRAGNADGFIQASELASLFQKLGIEPPPSAAEGGFDEFLKQFDDRGELGEDSKGGDGKLDRNEFLRIVGKLLDPAIGSQLVLEASHRKWMDVLKMTSVAAGDGDGDGQQLASSEEEQLKEILDGLDVNESPEAMLEGTRRILHAGRPVLLFGFMSDDLKEDMSKKELANWLCFSNRAKAATRQLTVELLPSPAQDDDDDGDGSKTLIATETTPLSTNKYKISVWVEPGQITGMTTDTLSSTDKATEGEGDGNAWDYYVVAKRGSVNHQHFVWHRDIPATVKLGWCAMAAPSTAAGNQDLKSFSINVVPPEACIAKQVVKPVPLEPGKAIDPLAGNIHVAVFSGPCHISVETHITCMPRMVVALPKNISDDDRSAFEKLFSVLPVTPPPAPAECLQHSVKAEHRTFQEWLDRGKLRFDPKKESVFSFALRTVAHIGKTLKYDCTEKTLAKRVNLASMIEWGKSDCGGKTDLFNNVMVENGIKVRENINFQHVFPTIYIDNVGWVPLEATLESIDGVFDSEQSVPIMYSGFCPGIRVHPLLPAKKEDDGGADAATANSNKNNNKSYEQLEQDAIAFAENFTRAWYESSQSVDSVLAKEQTKWFTSSASFQEQREFLKECNTDNGELVGFRKDTKSYAGGLLIVTYTKHAQMDLAVNMFNLDSDLRHPRIVGVGGWCGCDDVPEGDLDVPSQSFEEMDTERKKDEAADSEIVDAARSVEPVHGQLPTLEILEMVDDAADYYDQWTEGMWLWEDKVARPGVIDLSPGCKFDLEYGHTFSKLQRGGPLPRPVPGAGDFDQQESSSGNRTYRAGVPLNGDASGGVGAAPESDTHPPPIAGEQQHAEWLRQFDNFDDDGSGTLQKSELNALFLSYYPDLSVVGIQEKVQQAFERFDTNKDGVLSKKEFLVLCGDLLSSSGEEEEDQDYEDDE